MLPGTFPARHQRGGEWNCSGRKANEYEYRCVWPCGPSRKKSSRKVLPQHLLGSVAVAAVVLGCAWTVYTNVFGASVYPSMNSAAFDAPVVKQSSVVAARPARPTFNEVFASLPRRPPEISAPETVPSSIMFNERFAAAAPQGEAPRPVEATQVAEGRRRR